MRIDFGYVPGGYGWIFPKGEHLNVGLYTQRAGTKFSKNDLVAYARGAIGTDRVDRIAGYPIGIGGERHQGKRQRIFLAGDAAGMTERLLGEGIHNALLTGQAAALAILAAGQGGKSAQAQYRDGLEAVQRDLKACRVAANWFYDLQFLGLARWFPVPKGAALMRGFAAGMTFRDIMRTCWFCPSYPVESVPAVREFEAAARPPNAPSQRGL
jgi:flavin-dependent dehydrogenase